MENISKRNPTSRESMARFETNLKYYNRNKFKLENGQTLYIDSSLSKDLYIDYQQQNVFFSSYYVKLPILIILFSFEVEIIR